MSNKKIENKYCTQCGSKLIQTFVGAEEYIAHYGDDAFRIHEPFNDKNGKRQYVLKYQCPNKKWYNFHDSYMVDQLITSNQ